MKRPLVSNTTEEMTYAKARSSAIGKYKRMSKLSDDEWLQVASNWDLNVWRDAPDSDIHVTLYPVVNGSTDTENFKVIK